MRAIRSLSVKIVVLFLFIIVLPRTGPAQFEEEEFFAAAEWVETASKRLQRIEESPAAVTVISAEEIRNSGATNMCDLLRRVPGLEVMVISASDCQIGARGHNQPMENGLLVLENGRSVYEDYFGVVVWNFKDFSLEMIERIEVVRGPGSVLYGANAFHAVINIITKEPSREAGGQISFTAGEDTMVGTIMGAAQSGRAGYLISAGWTQSASYEDPENMLLQYPRAKMSLHYELPDRGKIKFEGGIAGGQFQMFYTMLGSIEAFVVTPSLMAKYEYEDFYFRVYWNSMRTGRAEVPDLVLEGESAMGLPLTIGEDFEIDIDLENHLLDIESQYRHNLPAGNMVTLGASYRFSSNRYTLLEARGYETDDLFAAYLQHEFTFRQLLHSYLGVRWDHHPLTGENFSPRGSVLLTPLAGHVFRLSYGRSFRSPSFIESRMDIVFPVSVGGYPTRIGMQGNTEIAPEKLTSYEAGYQASLLANRVRLGANVFYNKIEGLIGLGIPFDLQAAIEGELYGSMENTLDGEAWGVEVEGKVQPYSWLSGFANYTYTRVEDLTFDETNPRTPETKINGGATFGPYQGFSTTVLAHYVSETYWPAALRSLDITPDLWFMEFGGVDAYYLINLHLAYRFLDDRAEVAFQVNNLLNKEHREYPKGEEIGVRYYGTARFSF